MVNLEYIQTALLDYGVHKAPAQYIWKVVRECWVINTSSNPISDLDWAWIEKTIGVSITDITDV
jgi:hypothetical protein